MWQQCSGPWCIPYENGNFWVLSLNFQVRFSTHGSFLLATWVCLVMLLHKASYNLHQRARILAVVFSWMIGIATQTKPTHQPWYRRKSPSKTRSKAEQRDSRSWVAQLVKLTPKSSVHQQMCVMVRFVSMRTASMHGGIKKSEQSDFVI